MKHSIKKRKYYDDEYMTFGFKYTGDQDYRIWIEKEFQKCATSHLLAELRNGVLNTGWKTHCGFIAVFVYLFVQESIFFLYLSENQVQK
jgi:hypothetical protein